MSLNVPLSILLEASGRGVRRVTPEARDVSFREVVPGGFASARVPLNRPLALQPDEIAYYSRLAISDARNGTIVFDGRLEDPARSAGPDGEVWELAAVGPSAHALDRTVPLVYADRRHDAWRTDQGLSAKHVDITMAGSGRTTPVIRMSVDRGKVFANGQQGVVAYEAALAAGMDIARVSATWAAGVTDGNLELRLSSGLPVASEDSDTANTAGGSLVASLGGVPSWSNIQNLAYLHFRRNTSDLTVANDATWAEFMALAVRTKLVDATGTAILTGYTADTVLGHEIVADLLGRLLTKYDGASAEIATTSYAITQLAYPDGVTAHKLFEDLMLFEPDFYWAAWERLASGKHRFEWAAWPTTVRYEADATDGYDSAGSGDGLYDAVTVRWKDVNGEIRTNRRTQTVPELTAAGITREAFIDLGDEVGSSVNADRAGDQFLIQHLTPPNAGRLTLTRPIQDHVLGRMVMPWEIRAGHLIRVRGIRPRVDALNTSTRDGVTVFRVTAKDYAASRAAATLELDSYPQTVSRALAKVLQAKPMRRR